MPRLAAFLIVMLPALASAQGVVPTVTVTDAQNAAFSSWPTIALDAAISNARSIAAICTVAGNISLVSAGADTMAWPVYVGAQTLPFAPANIASAGTTATCIYKVLK